MLRVYDITLAEFLSLSFVDYDRFGNVTATHEVPMTFGSPRREFGDGTNSQQYDDFPPTMAEQIAMPSTTLTRLSETFDWRRYTNAEIRHLGYTDDLNLILTSPFPLPFTLMYQLDAWAETYHDLNGMHERFLLKFPNPVWPIDVVFPQPWGTKPVYLTNDGVQLTSTLEPGEDERYLRLMATVTMEAWLPLPAVWKRTVQHYSIQFLEQNTEELILLLESEWADKAEFRKTGEKNQVLSWHSESEAIKPPATTLLVGEIASAAITNNPEV